MASPPPFNSSSNLGSSKFFSGQSQDSLNQNHNAGLMASVGATPMSTTSMVTTTFSSPQVAVSAPLVSPSQDGGKVDSVVYSVFLQN